MTNNKFLSYSFFDLTDAMSLLYERLFNIVEWYCLLVNEKQIRDNKIIQHFKPVIFNYYEKTFLQNDYFSEDKIKNPEEYAEFKKHYKDLKDGKYD